MFQRYIDQNFKTKFFFENLLKQTLKTKLKKTKINLIAKLEL